MSREYVEHALALFHQPTDPAGRFTDICVFDLETSDKMYKSDDDFDAKGKVMQLAARRYRVWLDSGDWELTEELNVLLNDPTMTYLAEGAFKTHGISIEDCRRRGIHPIQAWSHFYQLRQGARLLGQNITGFDIAFANRELARWAYPEFLSTEEAIDTLLLARELYSFEVGRSKPGYKLRSLANFLKVETDPALDHDALGDIDTTWKVFLAMQADLRSYEAKYLRGTPNQYKRRLGSLGDAWRDAA